MASLPKVPIYFNEQTGNFIRDYVDLNNKKEVINAYKRYEPFVGLAKKGKMLGQLKEANKSKTGNISPNLLSAYYKIEHEYLPILLDKMLSLSDDPLARTPYMDSARRLFMARHFGSEPRPDLPIEDYIPHVILPDAEAEFLRGNGMKRSKGSKAMKDKMAYVRSCRKK
jgi:hypothetical protein